MTSSHEAVMSLTEIFFKCVYKVGTKTRKVSTSYQKPFGSDFEKFEGGHIDPPGWNMVNIVKFYFSYLK